MDVEYEITKDDLFAFHWRAATRRRPIPKNYLIGLAVAMLVMVLLNFRNPSRLGWFTVVSDLIGILVFLGVAGLLFWYLTRRDARRAIIVGIEKEKPDGVHLGRHKITLTEKEVIAVTTVAQSRTSWTGVDRVEQDDQYVFIYTAPNMAHLVPKRAFADRAAAERFYELAKRYAETASR